jgi:putative pyruvate formate lyase activating enzyme
MKQSTKSLKHNIGNNSTRSSLNIPSTKPAYLRLNRDVFESRIDTLYSYYNNCELCPRKCRIDRRTRLGFCRGTTFAGVASHNIHTGEEPFISGPGGSGTVFLHHCTLSCLFCQNFPISQLHEFKEVSELELANMFLELQDRGAHNINFVNPTHFLPSLVKAVLMAADRGLAIPIVYNSSGFENAEIIKMLEGIVDIYLPDMKYADDLLAAQYSDAPHYVECNRSAVREMFRQTGLLQTENGIAVKGLVVRHLVLPGQLENSREVLKHIAENISRDLTVSVMSQYFPAWKAVSDPDMNRELTKEEYDSIVEYALELGLENALIQEKE